MQKAYEPKDVETKWYDFWLSMEYFSTQVDDSKKPFCIVIPPPNVTGSLHMGHALNSTLQDILVRYKRMSGFNALWVPGMDHAGIATQNVVERHLADAGLTRTALGREQFEEKVWEWKDKYGGIITDQLKKLGASLDWKRARFTMDEGFSKAVREVFVKLYEKGLIYRGNYIINWCPRCKTAISDLEVNYEEFHGKLYYIDYPVKGEQTAVTVATTRPETMLGDTAVAVHERDRRYKKLHKKTIILPLLEREIPLILDNCVDKKFGTGAVKVTPAHDLNDFDMGSRHNLAMIKVMDEDGVINEQGGPYMGLDRFACREKLLKDLERNGNLNRVEEYTYNIGSCYRCHTIIEPTVSEQWFVMTKPLAKEAISAVKDQRIRIIPRMWEKTYFEWMENIRDWCISRQLWWGHRIPAWYCNTCGEIIVAQDTPKECRLCGDSALRQDEDVLDTWFSSALWPFGILGWPDKTKDLALFYPTSVLVTAFDILFFWVARMIMMGIEFLGEVPFKDVFIHALVRDIEGQKMSKSKGNIIDPLSIIDTYGADAFRFTLAAFAAQGRDIKMSEQRIEGYRHFVNKIWNASRFILMNIENYNESEIVAHAEQFSDINQWILCETNEMIRSVRMHLDDYRFNDAAQCIYQFIWHEFCDWYIEFSKIDLYKGNDPRKKRETQYVLLRVLNTIVKVLHPFMPFVTEEIWHKLPHSKNSITVAEFPEYDNHFGDRISHQNATLVKNAITAIRNIRGEMGVHPSTYLDAKIHIMDEKKIDILSTHNEYIMNLAHLNNLEVGKEVTNKKGDATKVIEEMEIYVPLLGIVDFTQERKRVEKEIVKITNELSHVEKKLSNKNFVNKAPEDVVEKEKRIFSELHEKKNKLVEMSDRLREFDNTMG
ncbi:MAG: valine--tRNA ligase [Thermodesulfobacteriota bacterium]|nr:valine--tRNA ligase [Thermodesulfobacteriota bacterium]